MIKNYLKITFRNLYRNKVSTIINLLGLSLGITVCLLIFLLIDYELNFDNFHSKKDRIYRVVREESNASTVKNSPSTPFPMHAALAIEFPEMVIAQIFEPSTYQLKVDDHVWVEDNVLFADSDFFKVFDYPAIAGNPVASFKNPNVAVITESMAKSRFGDQSPIGKTVNISKAVDVEIVGILKDPPKNSHLPFSMVVMIDSFSKDLVGGFDYESWNVTLGFTNYVILPEETSELTFQKGLDFLSKKYLSEESANHTAFSIQPLREIHFNKLYAQSNVSYTMDITYLMVLGVIGIFILLLACINFINLSTAVAIRKSKEVGVRKVMGASRPQLIYQYMSEAFILTIFSSLIALGVAERVLPLLNGFLDTGLTLSTLGNPTVIWIFLGGIVMVSILSGLYPAWVLSGYKPVTALKARIGSQGSSSLFLRRGLVVFQFVISQVLIIGTLVVASQMNYFRNKPLGFDTEYIVTFGLNDNDTGKLETMKNRLLENPNVQQVSFAVGTPTSSNDMNSEVMVEGIIDDFEVGIKAVDYDYQATFDLQLAAGRWFLNKAQDAKGVEFLLNETAVRQLGFSSPDDVLGKIISFGLDDQKAPVVGVVKDFHVSSLREAIKPIVLLQHPGLYFEGGIKISGQNVPETIAHIKSVWDGIFPGFLFDYKFLDESLAENYSREEQLYTVFKVFSTISIGIGCLGLFGLISFLVVQKTKEVGVRKVLGASVSSVVILFSKDFMKLLLIAFFIAAPICWYVMGKWLGEFAYRIELEPYYFVIGGLLNVLVAFVTISYQSIKAARSNPVESLRTE